MGWCFFPVTHGVIFAHNIVDFRELDAYTDKTVIVIDINNTPLDSFADCCEAENDENDEGDESGGRERGLMTYTEIRFNPKPERPREGGASSSSFASFHRASTSSSSQSQGQNTVSSFSSSTTSTTSSAEENRDRSSNTEAYLPPPPADPRTIVYKTQKRFSSATDVIDLLNSIENYQVF